MSYYPRNTWISILKLCNSYEQATQRLKNVGFTYNKLHHRWEDNWHNWISDSVIREHYIADSKVS